ncbi:MAG: type II and III secretion system protein family protein [Chlorobaculum sp.]|nr:type II and III secretion system protein family protein [Chlorobaculum sp.]
MPVESKPSSVVATPVAKKASRLTSDTVPVTKKSTSRSISEKPRVDAKKNSRLSGGYIPLGAITSPSIYRVPLGESRVYRFAQPIKRIAVGDPKVADYILLNPNEIYLLGKQLGSTNLSLWDQQGNLISAPVQVSRSIATLQDFLKTLFPAENDIHILALGHALVLSGSVSDALVAESVSRLVTSYLGGAVPGGNPESALIGSDSSALKGIIGENNKVSTPVSVSTRTSITSGEAKVSSAVADSTRGVVNLLKIRNSQQVQLEVCIAQVSRDMIESMGVSFLKASGDLRGGTLLSGVVSSATLNNVLRFFPGNANAAQVVADHKPSLFRVLADPTIVTLSGKEGYFLVGGKVFVPVGIDRLTGDIRYEAEIYGVGLRFKPIVLDGSRISLKVVAEFSEPETGIILAGTATNWPAFRLSTVSTHVEMGEGENLVIGGLKLDKLVNTIESVPLLGKIPILGALFRDAKKKGEKSELMIIVRPTLVNGSITSPKLPTDKYLPPTDKELFLDGKLYGEEKK